MELDGCGAVIAKSDRGIRRRSKAYCYAHSAGDTCEKGDELVTPHVASGAWSMLLITFLCAALFGTVALSKQFLPHSSSRVCVMPAQTNASRVVR
jgi:hypothetical protein